jgi:hypothetical protein
MVPLPWTKGEQGKVFVVVVLLLVRVLGRDVMGRVLRQFHRHYNKR